MISIYDIPKKIVEYSIYGILCLALSISIAFGSWLVMAGVLGIVILVAIATAGLRPIAMLWLFGIPTFFVFPNNFIANVPSLTVDRVFFGMLLVMILLGSAFKKLPKVKWIPIEVSMIVFLSYIFLSLLRGGSGNGAIGGFRKDISFFVQGYFMPMTSFFIARRLSWREKDMETLFKLFFVAGLFLATTSVLQYYLGITIFVPKYMLVIHSATRATGTFSNASEYGAVQSVFFIISLFLFFRTQDKFLRTVLLLFSIFIFVGVLLSKTRAPWLGLICSLLLIYAYDRKNRITFNVSLGIVFISALVALPFFLDSVILKERVGEVSPIYNRLALWATGLNMIIHNPLTGIGFGVKSFLNAKQQYTTGVGYISAQWTAGVGVPHNELIHITALTGLIGTCLYALVIYNLFSALKVVSEDVNSTPFRKDCALYIKSIVICFVVNAMFVDLGKFNYFAILVYFLVGAVIAIGEEDDAIKKMIENKRLKNNETYK